MSTDTSQFVTDLNGGVFDQQLSHALSEVAMGVVNNKKAGKIVITMELTHLGDGSQVNIKHKLDFMKPTSKGSVREDVTASTPMHVGKQGKLTLFPEMQTDMFKTTQTA